MLTLAALPTTLLLLISTAVTAHAEELSQGVKIDTLKAAECGRKTKQGDVIKVDYRGSLLDGGAEFDNSYDRGKPFSFQLGAGQVIAGWDMALLGMCPDESRRLTIPPELAYGQKGVPGIPPGSTLVFDTVLREIIGVQQPAPTTSAETSSALAATEVINSIVHIATAPAEPPKEHENEKKPADGVEEDYEEADVSSEKETAQGSADGPLGDQQPVHKRCQLLGMFALLVQGALGGFALLTLVWKRYRESPQRPWKIWFFDVSKQIFGSMLTHVLNVGMSMISSVNLANHAEKFANQAADGAGNGPNPCSFYLLNLAIDTTLGIPVLYILLIIVHALCMRTPLARPPQSLKSGNYGEPPKWSWYLKQLMIYFIGLTGMKFCVFLLFSALPWLPWVGDWALKWTQFDERVEIAFALFIFPLFMNAVQYYVIDNLIMDKNRDKTGYQAVDEDDEEARLVEESTLHDDEDERFKIDDEDELRDAEIAPLDPQNASSSSKTSTLRGDTDIGKKAD